jgi:hypothetical protein
MSKHKDYDRALQKLKEGGASMRCKDLVDILQTLGFEVRNGKSAGHKVVSHSGLPGFTSAGFNCGHGDNPEVKRPYVKSMVALLERHEDELRAFLKGEAK